MTAFNPGDVWCWEKLVVMVGVPRADMTSSFHLLLCRVKVDAAALGRSEVLWVVCCIQAGEAGSGRLCVWVTWSWCSQHSGHAGRGSALACRGHCPWSVTVCQAWWGCWCQADRVGSWYEMGGRDWNLGWWVSHTAKWNSGDWCSPGSSPHQLQKPG